jgi:hypothetical protein
MDVTDTQIRDRGILSLSGNVNLDSWKMATV